MNRLKTIQTANIGNERAKLILGSRRHENLRCQGYRIRTSRKIENGENTEYREY